MSTSSSARSSVPTSSEKWFAAVSYLGVLCVVPLLLKRDSAFVQHHAKQGAVVFVAWIVLWIGNVVPILGWLFWLVGAIVLLVLMVVGITSAVQGTRWEMPVLGSFAKKFHL